MLKDWILKNHSYDIPEVIALPIVKGSSGLSDYRIEGSNCPISRISFDINFGCQGDHYTFIDTTAIWS